jgi:hypothetical protein
MLHYSSLKILTFPSFCLRWETTCTAPSRTTACARGVCIVTTSFYCCGMPLCRLATGTEPQSTTVGSMRSTTYNAVRSTLISHPTLCFLTGARGPRGLLGRHGRCYGEGCSHGTHCSVLTELGCYCMHAPLDVSYPGPL